MGWRDDGHWRGCGHGGAVHADHDQPRPSRTAGNGGFVELIKQIQKDNQEMRQGRNGNSTASTRYRCSTGTGGHHATPATRAIVLLHRGHEHSGRVTHLVDELDLPDTAFFAWDARGNGRSPGARGDAPGFPALVRDLDSFIAHIGAEHGIAVEDIVVIAQSGAVVAATCARLRATPACAGDGFTGVQGEAVRAFARPGS